MKNREFKKALEEARKESKKNVDNARNNLKRVVDCAENAIIIQTDNTSAIVANKYDTCEILCHLFEHLIEECDFTKKELISLINIAEKTTEKEEKNESSEETLNKISELLDKAIKLQELQNKNKDED